MVVRSGLGAPSPAGGSASVCLLKAGRSGPSDGLPGVPGAGAQGQVENGGRPAAAPPGGGSGFSCGVGAGGSLPDRACRMLFLSSGFPEHGQAQQVEATGRPVYT